MERPDADREPLVEELVGHHVPVDDLRGDDRQAGPECQPERHDRPQTARAPHIHPSGSYRSAPLCVLGILGLRRLDVAGVVDLAAGELVGERARAVLSCVVPELVAGVAETGDAGEVVAQPVPRAGASALDVCTRTGEVLHAEKAAYRRAAAWGQPAAERRHRRTCEGAADSRRQLPLPARARPFDRGELAGVGADGAEPTRRPAPDAYRARVGVERPVVAFDPGIDVVLHAVRDRDHRFAATARWTW